MRQAERIRYLVLAAQREGNRQLAAALRPLQLTPAQAEVVRVLADNAPLTLTELGELLVCESGTNPSRLIDRLVTSGLVNREIDIDDRRVVNLSLTAEGSEVESRVRNIEDSLYDLIDSVTHTSHTNDGYDDAKRMIGLLERLVDGSSAGNALAKRALKKPGDMTASAADRL